MRLEEETSVSEINILPDGRICLFGASQQVLEILDSIVVGDRALTQRLDCLRRFHRTEETEQNHVRL